SIPQGLGGTDEYEHLRIIHKEIHRLIHMTNKQTIESYFQKHSLTVEQVKRINQYRRACNLEKIKQ
ncbi:group II intron reverse transcriptase/maturase, partial [Bacillus cereus]|nr:group II intron reverse transcriptase/maturase [Bacillus cereus]